MNVKERIFVIVNKIKGVKNQQLRESFSRKFRRPGPTDKSIRQLFCKFMRTGSVHDEPKSGRPRRSEEDVDSVAEAFRENPRMSTRSAALMLDIPQTSICIIIHKDLGKRAYHIQMIHHLIEEDYPKRSDMCASLLQKIRDEDLLDHVMFSDEATFHLCAKVNRHNCRIWGTEKPSPSSCMEWIRDTPKVNVWLGMTRSKVYGPFFFAENTVTGVIYLDMLQQFLEPQLIQDGILDTVVFQQDGAPCHYAKICREYLNTTFCDRWIGRDGPMPWAARSPDLTPLDFFAWGFIKSQVYRSQRITRLSDLCQLIRDAVELISVDMLERVFDNLENRLVKCMDNDGRHIECL